MRRTPPLVSPALLPAGLFWLCLAAAAPAADVNGEAEGFKFFETQVRPLLAARCWDCHSDASSESKLRLDSLAGMLTGGTRGPAIVPGMPERSLLVSAINHGETLQMPPKEKLPQREIRALTQWIKMGAPWPNAAPLAPPSRDEEATPSFTDEEKAFRSFQPIGAPQPPQVDRAQWVQTPLDRFILARLEAAGLSPAPPADKRTLIRRATFDLTGLPPTPAEIDAFEADEAPDAYARLIDRLLASPRYGERWGRHWLDVARYADSNGLDENLAYINAYRYRDWVIRAFNRDLPYDRFVQQQLAGDLLPAQSGETESERLDRMIATAFLSLGPKMLAEDDPVKMEMDIIDEQIDTVGRALMGLTFGCARCHDHKFDPLRMSDYYALAGIFKSTKTMENFGVVANWREFPVATHEQRAAHAAHEEALRTAEARLQARVASAQQAFLAAHRKLAGRYVLAAAQFVDFSTVQTAERTDPKTLVPRMRLDAQPPEGSLVVEAENYTRGTILKSGPVIKNGSDNNFFNEAEYDLEIPRDGNYQLELLYACGGGRKLRLYIDGQLVKPDAANGATGGFGNDQVRWFAEGIYALKGGPITLRIEHPGPIPHLDRLALLPTDLPPTAVVRGRADSGRTLAQVAGDLKLHEGLLNQWIGYLQSTGSGDGTLAARLDLTDAAAQRDEAGGEAPAADEGRTADEALANRYQAQFDRADAAWRALRDSAQGKQATQLPDAALEPFRAALYDPQGPYRLPAKVEDAFSESAKAEIEQLGKEKSELEESRPPLPMAMGVADGRVQNVRIHLRGSHLTLGREVPRRFPCILAGTDQAPLDEATSGRLQLARWITRADHPLTARVMVNRIWYWHFGSGVVRTPDNFGRLGEAPTHPRLLDWLARQFIESGWSVKHMQRLMMRSATYQMSTAYDGAADAKDPENRLRWRMDRRRLSAEEIRDTILALGGSLDLEMGGQLLSYKPRDYVTGTGSIVNRYDYNRRTVYLPVLRSAVYNVSQAFDFPDPSMLSGTRETTTVAPQSLFMMNSELVAKQAMRLAEQLVARGDLDDAARVDRAFQLVLGRHAQTGEASRFVQFVHNIEQQELEQQGTKDEIAEQQQEPDQARLLAWRSLCRVLFASNEFIYVE